MAMDFWQAQRHARRQTFIYLVLFLLLSIVAAICLEFGMRYYDPEDYNTSLPLFGLTFLAITFIAASIQYGCFLSVGGKYVAESMGARHLVTAQAQKKSNF